VADDGPGSSAHSRASQRPFDIAGDRRARDGARAGSQTRTRRHALFVRRAGGEREGGGARKRNLSEHGSTSS
jgi:hypothetical protein